MIEIGSDLGQPETHPRNYIEVEPEELDRELPVRAPFGPANTNPQIE